MSELAKKKPQKLTRELMPFNYVVSMEMKFEGRKYAEIAAKTGLKEGTLRHLFCKGGLLHERYKEYVITEKARRQELGLNLYSAHIEAVSKKLISIAMSSRSDNASVSAIKEINERIFGKVSDTLDVKGNIVVGFVDLLKLAKEKNERRDGGHISEVTE